MYQVQPVKGKQMPSVLHSESCWGHIQKQSTSGDAEGSKSEHRAAQVVMDLSELELSLESDPCPVALGL